MDQETNNSVSYLTALKHAAAAPGTAAGAQQATPASAPDPTAVPSLSQAFAGAEKRRSPRFKCEGSVQFREAGSDVSTWANFTDISLHGCYVEATATYPVGTVLDTRLEANGIRVHARGCVKVNYPQLGMGVAFTEMSEENRGHLRTLVRSLSRRSTIMGAPPVAIEPQPLPAVVNAAAVLEAIMSFFEDRQLLPKEEFLRILRKKQGSETR